MIITIITMKNKKKIKIKEKVFFYNNNNIINNG